MATATDPQLEAFTAAFDEFVRAAKRARARHQPDALLSPGQYDLLAPLLDGDEPPGLTDLARAAGVSAPTATRMLDGLQRRGLVSRKRAAEDRRAIRVTLTTAGRAAVLDHRARQLRRRRALFEQLSPADRRAAARVLSRLAAAYEEAIG